MRDSDGTLVLLRGPAEGGTRLTLECARALGRPCHVCQLGRVRGPEELAARLQAAGIRTLNVAGPRESERPGIGDEAAALLRRLLAGVS